MVSRINPNFPVSGRASTASVRANFRIAQEEITELQTDYVPEVPNTGAFYVRAYKLWAPLGPTGGGVGEVPATPAGASWVRRINTWVNAFDGGQF